MIVFRYIGLQKVVKNKVQGNGAALARYQGIEEQQRGGSISSCSSKCAIASLRRNAMLSTRRPDWGLALPVFDVAHAKPSIHKRT